MRWVYASRRANRGGYYILRHLLERGEQGPPLAVVLPAAGEPDPRDDPALAPAERARYQEQCQRQGCRPLRFLESISLLAAEHGVPLLELATLKGPEARQALAGLGADLLVVGGGWPELLPLDLLAAFPLGAINAHPSLLPAWRGTDVHRWQVLAGVTRSGTTIHYLDQSFDQGDIIARVEIDVSSQDTPQDLADKAGRAAGPLMARVLADIAEAAPGRLPTTPQPQTGQEPCRRWPWDDAGFLALDWTRPARQLERLVMACTQENYIYNGPHFTCGGRQWLVRRAREAGEVVQGEPGMVARISQAGPIIACGEGGLLLEQVQPSSSQVPHTEPAMSGAAWTAEAAMEPGRELAIS